MASQFFENFFGVSQERLRYEKGCVFSKIAIVKNDEKFNTLA